MAHHLPLGVSLAGLPEKPGAPWAGGPRSAIGWAGAAGFPAVQLDAAAPGLRPRELDRSARRDVASILRRCGLSFCGLDLWVPAPHYADPARAERALEAALSAIALAADLASLAGEPGAAIVALTLPDSGSARDHLAKEAELRGVSIADHAPPTADAAPAARGSIGVGIDPAATLMRGLDPAAAALRVVPSLVQARLSDAGDLGRSPVGAGRLDLPAYIAALVAAGYARAVVLDLRALPDPAAAAQAAASAWPGSFAATRGSVK
ncbi:MAG: hypothetical protein WD749_14955 [Phycisphaerales bacterium]